MSEIHDVIQGCYEIINLEDEHLMGIMSPIFSNLESVDDLLI